MTSVFIEGGDPCAEFPPESSNVFFNGFYLLCPPVLAEGVPPAPLRDFDDEEGQHREAVPPRTEPDHPRYSWPGRPVCLVNCFVLILIWYFLHLIVVDVGKKNFKCVNCFSFWIDFDDDYSFVNEGLSLKGAHFPPMGASHLMADRLGFSPTLRDGCTGSGHQSVWE